jgi:CHAD domain-containing protein
MFESFSNGCDFLKRPVKNILDLLAKQERILQSAFRAGKKKPDEGSIHALRLAIKRLKIILVLLHRGGKLKNHFSSSSKSLMRIFKAAGKIRDIQLSKKLLSGIRDKNESVEIFQKLLSKKEKDYRRKLTVHISAFPFNEGLAKPFARTAKQIAAIPAPELEKIIYAVLSHESTTIGEALRKSYSDPEIFHEIRKKYKIAFMLSSLAGKKTKAPFRVREIKKLKSGAEAIGKWRDNEILLKSLRKYLKKTRKQTGVNALQVMQIENRIETRSLRLLGKVYTALKVKKAGR